MAEDKIIAGEESFNQDNSHDETTGDNQSLSESEVSEVSECIEKEMEELEVRRTKVTCPVSLMIMDRHKEILFNYLGIRQKRLEEVMYGVQPGQESLKEDYQTLTDLEIEINTDEKTKI
ncbi:uncharacterized protein LOC129876737 [Solanum dulcamara]|uniref:uncharacterized protein LOC129876737 n=1 Tax=Solanum dulcamara TaxID=45834 RepID=UPI002485CF2E|nr:uncharacterized protein LOC129876737 [Solanum dulcamara]XP_055808212.1 uncharacterized protein LOC129876737 [Solanum dulcamara]